MHFTMKKTYIAPQTNAIALNIESNILDTSPNLGINSDSTNAIESNQILSNKKENPVWGGQSKGPWGE